MVVSRQRLIILALAITGMLVLSVFVYRQTFGYWPRLRQAVESFNSASGLEVIAQREVGTTFCVITCGSGEAAIVMNYRGAAGNAEEMCRAVGESARRVFEETHLGVPNGDLPLGLVGCVYAKMPKVGSSAYLVANTVPPCEDGVENCIVVTFSSGIE